MRVLHSRSNKAEFRALRPWLWLAAVALQVGCASPMIDPQVPSVAEAGDSSGLFQPTVESEYRFQLGDRIRIASYYDPQLNQDVVVRPDGRISLLFLDDIYVVGMSPTELDTLVTETYSRHLELAEITVVVVQTNNMNIYIGGEVGREAVLPISGPMTISQSITAAGGFLPSANQKQVLLLRKQDDGSVKTYQLDAERILLADAPTVYLRRSDVVFVPKTQIAHAGQFVDQYINKIIPEAIRFTLGYSFVSNKIDSDGNNSVIQVVPQALP